MIFMSSEGVRAGSLSSSSPLSRWAWCRCCAQRDKLLSFGEMKPRTAEAAMRHGRTPLLGMFNGSSGSSVGPL